MAFSALCSLVLVASSAIAVPLSSTKSVGMSVSDIYQPTASIDTAVFPNESQVGFAGPTPTGAEPFAIATAPAFPSHTTVAGIVVGAPSNNNRKKPFATSHSQFWGNLSPQFSVDSSVYGLPNASPIIPKGYDISQVHYYYRHGARYPTSGSATSKFASELANATFSASGPLSFLNTWTYKLGAELLTPFGRQENFDLGVQARILYGHLLNNFTATNQIPVFRTESQDRMVKTALNFAAGFFGIPNEGQYALEIAIEAPGLNTTGAPYFRCPNSNALPGSLGKNVSTAFASKAFIPTVARLQTNLQGFNLTTSDIISMLQLCSYETVALGYSEFCSLFTEEDFINYEYQFSLSFYYGQGFGSLTGAAQGKAYVEELLARLTTTLITTFDSVTNSTLDSSNITFPLTQSVYADAAHEVAILDAVTALNLTGINPEGALPLDHIPTHHAFSAARTVPFATNLVTQVVQDKMGVSHIRFILNDAVIPLSYSGCPKNGDGFCPTTTVINALQMRLKEIDFDYDCFGNYTVPAAGKNTNGRAPKAPLRV